MLLFILIFALEMDNCGEIFSLEDTELSQMFITQESNVQDVDMLDRSEDKMDTNEDIFLGNDKGDFASPCVSLINKLELPEYSDISDDDQFVCSQVSCTRKE